jgi:hypothetical protein
MHATCPTYTILFDLITLTVFGEEHRKKNKYIEKLNLPFFTSSHVVTVGLYLFRSRNVANRPTNLTSTSTVSEKFSTTKTTPVLRSENFHRFQNKNYAVSLNTTIIHMLYTNMYI